jgi:hypothetical protein
MISAKIKMRQPLQWLQKAYGLDVIQITTTPPPVTARFVQKHCNPLNVALDGAIYLGSESFMLASAYPMTAMAAPFSRSSLGTILSSVSAAL